MIAFVGQCAVFLKQIQSLTQRSVISKTLSWVCERVTYACVWSIVLRMLCLTDYVLGVVHLGWSSLPTALSSGWPCTAVGRNSKSRFLEVLSHDPWNIPAKFHRRRPSCLGALGFRKCRHSTDEQIFDRFCKYLEITKQEVKVIWQKAPHGGPIPRLGVTAGGRKLYYWIPGVGFRISVP